MCSKYTITTVKVTVPLSMAQRLAVQTAGKAIISHNLHVWLYLNICNAVQKLFHPAVVDVVGPVDEVLVDVDLGQAAVGELLPLLKDATGWRMISPGRSSQSGPFPGPGSLSLC